MDVSALTTSTEIVYPPKAISARQTFKLKSKDIVTHDTFLFRFELPGKDQSLGIEPGQYVTVYSEKLSRPYSPTSLESDKGFFDLVVKIYPPNEYPNRCLMSRYLESLHIGDEVIFEGPTKPRCSYNGNGTFTLRYDKTSPVESVKHFKNIGMVAGGTGVSPMFPIVKQACLEPSDITKFQMVFSNHTEEDILLRSELDSLADKNHDKFKVYYTLSKSATPGWKYGTGRVNETMLKANLPAPSSDTLILICGPPEFKIACKAFMKNLGYTKNSIMVV